MIKKEKKEKKIMYVVKAKENPRRETLLARFYRIHDGESSDRNRSSDDECSSSTGDTGVNCLDLPPRSINPRTLIRCTCFHRDILCSMELNVEIGSERC